jgi:hypothetical protein
MTDHGVDIADAAIRTIVNRAQTGITTGQDRTIYERAYYRRCTHFHWRTGTVVMFTRDSGHHSSGWMKNPDYERCRHLSLSFREPFPGRDAAELGDPGRIARLGIALPAIPFNPGIACQWVWLIHGDEQRWSWEEGPFSAEGKALGVRHWRVFCDPAWAAIKPRGEVYNTDFTEKGWKSWSEAQGEEKNWVDAE